MAAMIAVWKSAHSPSVTSLPHRTGSIRTTCFLTVGGTTPLVRSQAGRAPTSSLSVGSSATRSTPAGTGPRSSWRPGGAAEAWVARWSVTWPVCALSRSPWARAATSPPTRSGSRSIWGPVRTRPAHLRRSTRPIRAKSSYRYRPVARRRAQTRAGRAPDLTSSSTRFFSHVSTSFFMEEGRASGDAPSWRG